jgi:hypothetical protein
MRRVILGLLLSLVSFAAHAACPGNPPTCGNPMMSEAAGSVMYATGWGVQADGTTSDDVALKAATDACAAAGSRLILPPGKILLTGAATITISHCHIEGVDVPAGRTPVQSQGTIFYITSTTVKPFIMKSYWKLSGVSLYWPNQTGVNVYPPAFSGNGTDDVSVGVFENVTIVNAYDGVVQTDYDAGANNPVESWGDIRFLNHTSFAVRDNIRVSTVGDGLTLTTVRVLPGAWLNMCAAGSACNGYVGQAASTERFVHVVKPSPSMGGGLNINAQNLIVVGARYGFLIDNGAQIAISQVSGTFDTVGTIIDTSAGGHWLGFGATFTGTGTGCAIPATVWGAPNGGNAPCFNLGPGGNDELVIENFHIAGSQGDYVRTAGSAVSIVNSEMLSVGGANDGAEYYTVNVTGGNPEIRLSNNRFGGSWGGAHSHGFHTAAGITPNRVKIEGNTFDVMADAINAALPNGSIVANNASGGMVGAGPDFVLQGPGSVTYYGNLWARAPVPTVVPGSCGGSPPAVQGGPNSGVLIVGTGTVTSCNMAAPFLMNGICTFHPGSSISIGGGPSGVAPRVWSMNFYVGPTPTSSPGMIVFYNCPGYN